MKRPIFMTKEQEAVKEWTPSLKTAIEARDLRRKKFTALGTGEQALVTAFLCNRFPGKKAICTKCSSGEYVTRGHLQRCKYMHKHVKKFDWDRPAQDMWALVKLLKTAARLVQK